MLKDELTTGNGKADGSRKKKIESMTEAMNHWAGKWKDKEIF